MTIGINMNNGTIKLDNLYKHAASDPDAESIKGNSKIGRAYGKKAVELTSSIEASHGFYIWGKYEKNKLWRTIYLGKAGYGKTTSLKARITEELKDERAFLWHGLHSKLNETELLKVAENHYPNMWHKYESHFKRAIRKNGATHIIWAVTPKLTNSEVVKIEADLIETLNPIANVQRPSPTSDLQGKTIEIIKILKSQIHAHRNKQ